MVTTSGECIVLLGVVLATADSCTRLKRKQPFDSAAICMMGEMYITGMHVHTYNGGRRVY